MHQFSRYFRSLLLVLAVLTTRSAAQTSQAAQPLSDRIDAIVAHPLILPIKVAEPKAVKSGLRVRLDDGRKIEANAYFVWASVSDAPTGWTKGAPIWNLQTVSEYLSAPPSSPGTWIASIDLPIDAVGQGIWIEGTRYEPNWLPSPQRVILETSSRANDGFWDPVLTESQWDALHIHNALANLRADPFNRWRARLLTEGFNPSDHADPNLATSDRDLTAIHTQLLQSDNSKILDQIADHFTARWQIILGRIWLIDPAAARRLKHQLTRTVSVDGQQIPMWTDDPSQLSALSHDLLSPFVNDELRVERVTVWLDAQPDGLSWVIDDAGHPSRHPMTITPTIGMLWLSETNHTSTARIESSAIAPLIETISPNIVTERTFAAPTENARSQGQINRPRQLNTQIGTQRTALSALGSIPHGSPPGIIVGPLLNDWTLGALSSLNSAQDILPPVNRRVAGLVYRATDLNETDPHIGWQLYLECAISPGDDPTITLSVGPMNATRAAWSISKSLGLLEMRTDPDIIADPDYTSVIDDDRWIITLDIPPEAISDDGFLLLGIERTDQRAHTAWPRRMMPWQNEPGRFIIDTTNWSGMNTAP